MKSRILILLFMAMTTCTFSQTAEDVCAEMNNLKGFSISDLREYLILRASMQSGINKASFQNDNFYKDSIIIDGIPSEAGYSDSISFSNYTSLILDTKIKQICIQMIYDEANLKWSNFVFISTSHKRDKVYNVSGDNASVIIPAFSSGWFETRKSNGDCIKSVPFEPFHYDVKIEHVSNSALADDEMYITLICRTNNYIIGYYLK